MSKIFICIIALTCLVGCRGNDGEIGPNGLVSLLSITEEAPGENCEFGGSKVSTGIDTNQNNQLDTGEVSQTSFICNGATGSNGSLDEL